MPSLEELTTPLTVDEVKASIYETLATLGVTTTSWKPGAVVRTMIAGTSVVASAISQLMARIASSGFLELSSGEWLTAVAKERYNEDRILAVFASGQLLLSNSSAGTYNLDPGDLIVSSSLTGAEYRNTASITLLPGASAQAESFIALVAGSASTALAGEIDTVVSALTGVTVTHTDNLVGLDEESDADLRARCRDKLGSLSLQGPRDSYSYWAKRATRTSDGSAIGVTRVTSKPDGSGGVTVWVATPSGAVSGTQEDTGTDLGAVHDLMYRKAAPLSVTLTTVSAAEVSQDITYELWLYNDISLTESEISSKISTAFATHFGTRPIGGDSTEEFEGYLFHSRLEAVISSHAELRDHFVRLELTTPSGDVDLAENEIPVVGSITVTAIHLVPRPGAG